MFLIAGNANSGYTIDNPKPVKKAPNIDRYILTDKPTNNNPKASRASENIVVFNPT